MPKSEPCSALTKETGKRRRCCRQLPEASEYVCWACEESICSGCATAEDLELFRCEHAQCVLRQDYED